MRAYERLLNYVRVYTTSDPESGTHPSAAREFDLAHQLVEELKALGVEDAADKGDALLREYARTLIEYIEYYLRFDGVQGDMVSPIIDEKLDQLGDVYYLAVYAGRKEIIGEINAYYRSLGVEEENLVDVGDKPHQVDTTLIPRKDTAQ